MQRVHRVLRPFLTLGLVAALVAGHQVSAASVHHGRADAGPGRASTTGSPAPRAYVAVGDYTSPRPPSRVAVIDTSRNTVIRSIPVSGASAIAITPNGARLYVTDLYAGTAIPVETATSVVGPPIRVGLMPRLVIVSPDGATAYVANSDNTITPIETAGNHPRAVIRVGPNPVSMAVTPDGSTLYVAESNGTVTLVRTAGGTVRSSIRVGGALAAVGMTHDGSTAYVVDNSGGTIVPIPTSTNDPGRPIPVGRNPSDIVISPDDSTAYVASRNGTVVAVTLATRTVHAPITAGAVPVGLAITPGGRTVYVADIRLAVTPISTATGRARAPIPLGDWHLGIAIAPGTGNPTGVAEPADSSGGREAGR